jgi:hypothetical protein
LAKACAVTLTMFGWLATLLMTAVVAAFFVISVTS